MYAKFGRAGRRAAHAAVGLVLALAVSGCGVVVGGDGSVTEAPREVGSGQVGLDVFEDGGSGRLLLVPVHISDSGPYQFVLDTGASRSIVDSQIVEELELETGRSTQARSVSSEFRGETVAVEQWRIGDVELEPRTIVAADLPDAGGGLQFRGLLGSDVLAGFGNIEIDYDEQVLTLRGGEQSSREDP
ncbi:MAG: retropepsin-like aspartic protease [Actinomycetota bacterium]